MSSTIAASSSSITPFALKTTFTPASSCTQNHLTILDAREYQVWLNEPVPVSGTTMTDCYPSQFISSYVMASAGTSVSAFTELVCPQDHTTALEMGNYIACCPSGYGLGQNTGSADELRPAYGRTCYTDIHSITVTAYDSHSVTATSTLVFSTPAQAYAHVIDGYVARAAQVSVTMSSATSTATSAFESTSPSQSSTPSSGLSGGAVAGIVIGILGALFLGLLLGWALLRRRKTAATAHSEIPRQHANDSTVSYDYSAKEVVSHPAATYIPDMHGSAMANVPQGSLHHELPGYRPPVEMPGSSTEKELPAVEWL